MRKRAAAASIVSASAVLVIAWQVGAQAHPAPTVSTGASAPAAPVGTTGTTGSGSDATGATSTPAASTPTPSTLPNPATSTASGTFAGAVVGTRYGNVQVQITVAGGSITDVTALHLTDDEGRSVQISARAAPILRQEVLAAQTSSVQMVSGATYTSQAYLTSLQAAIDKAGL